MIAATTYIGWLKRSARYALFVLLVGVLVLALIDILATRRVEMLLGEIQQRGEPVLPKDIVFGEERRRDPLEWLLKVEALEGPGVPEAVHAAEWASEVEPDVVAEIVIELGMLLECMTVTQPSGKHSSLLLGNYIEKQSALLEEAADCGRYGRYQWAEKLDLSSGEVVPQVPASAYLRLVRTLCYAAVNEAYNGRWTGVISYLVCGFQCADIFSQRYLFHAHEFWTMAQMWLLCTLANVVSWAPANADFSMLDALIKEIDPIMDLRMAQIGERAYGNFIYEAFKRSAVPADAFSGLRLGGIGMRAYFMHDHLRFLSLMNGYISGNLIQQTEDSDRVVKTARISDFLIPNLAQGARAAASLEAERDLVLCLLMAHRYGNAKATHWITSRQDPLAEGGNYRACVVADGSLLAWSVGQNGVDDGGECDCSSLIPLDIVIRAKP